MCAVHVTWDKLERLGLGKVAGAPGTADAPTHCPGILCACSIGLPFPVAPSRARLRDRMDTKGGDAADVTRAVLEDSLWCAPRRFGLAPTRVSDESCLRRMSEVAVTGDRLAAASDEDATEEDMHWRYTEVVSFAEWNASQEAFVCNLGTGPHEPRAEAGGVDEKCGQACACAPIVVAVSLLSCSAKWVARQDQAASTADRVLGIDRVTVAALVDRSHLSPTLVFESDRPVDGETDMCVLQRFWDRARAYGLSLTAHVPVGANLQHMVASRRRPGHSVLRDCTRLVTCDRPTSQLLFRLPYEPCVALLACARAQEPVDTLGDPNVYNEIRALCKQHTSHTGHATDSGDARGRLASAFARRVACAFALSSAQSNVNPPTAARATVPNEVDRGAVVNELSELLSGVGDDDPVRSDERWMNDASLMSEGIGSLQHCTLDVCRERARLAVGMLYPLWSPNRALEVHLTPVGVDQATMRMYASHVGGGPGGSGLRLGLSLRIGIRLYLPRVGHAST
jgi:hypothetical protein